MLHPTCRFRARSIFTRPAWLLLALILAGCAAAFPAATPTPAPSPTQTPTPTPDSRAEIAIPSAVPELDRSKHSVPLDQIIFDTFTPGNRELPLSAAPTSRIELLRDAIPPLHGPDYETADQVGGWLREDDMVIGYAADAEAWAFPLRILNFHEIVNDNLGGEPVLISYCPLCFSGVVYSRRLGDETLTFGNTSALYESDMVMLDYESGSYWWQVAGEAIAGERTGARLTPLPSQTITWGEWRRLHPQTFVLSRQTGFLRDYSSDPFRGYAGLVNGGRFAFPVSDAALDGRLTPGTKVLLVRVGEEARAYPLLTSGRAVVSDVIGGGAVVIFLDGEAASGAAFAPEVAGQALTFELRSGEIIDRETESRWDLAGRAKSGQLAGAQLTPLPTKTSFWFAAVASEPGVLVYETGE